jgi:hypothetical protein
MFVQGLVPLGMRGVQGVAQALVGSTTSDVHVAVGMRNRLAGDDAERFLLEFFKSLLKSKPGNVEEALHSARMRLYTQSPQKASYCAPVLFSSLQADEPLFGFLGNAPTAPTIPSSVEAFDRTRGTFWDALVKAPWSWRSNDADNRIVPFHNVLNSIDNQIAEDLQPHIGSVMPAWSEGQTGTEIGPVPVMLRLPAGGAAVSAGLLTGTLIVDHPGVTITDVSLAPAAEQAGYELLAGRSGRPSVRFRIERSAGANQPLDDGELMRVKLATTNDVTGVITFRVDGFASTPVATWYGGVNAIIIPTS